MHQHTLLIATHDGAARAFLASRFDADSHTFHRADNAAATTRRPARMPSTSCCSATCRSKPANAPDPSDDRPSSNSLRRFDGA